MAPACFIGVICTGNIHHIRRHGFTCGKRRNACSRKHAQAHKERHEQGERLFQCFHLVTSLKWPQKKHIALDVLLPAGFGLRSKKERHARPFSLFQTICRLFVKNRRGLLIL